MITVNKETVQWWEGMTVSDALKARNYIFPIIIVSINGRMIPRDRYPTQTVSDNDEIKAIHIYGGG
jgi:thiamine biosynthesis protein ThiS